MAIYLGILDGTGNTFGVRVRVPDLPGVNGGGDSPAAAIADAISAAREWVAHHVAKDAAIPAPRALDLIEREMEPGERVVEIPVD